MSIAPAPIAADYSRHLPECEVTLVGCGGSHHLATNLARSGVRRFRLIDDDTVAEDNLCRADFLPQDVGLPKVVALAHTLRTLGADAEFHVARFEEVPKSLLANTTLLIAATDSFAGQAAVNRHALMSRTPALYCGLAQQGCGGELVFWYPGLPCFRCLLSKRYELHENRATQPDRIPSAGTTPFDLAWSDAIAGHLALGLMLRGTATRFGKLLETLAERNFLRLKIDPDYRQSGGDHVRTELGIPADNTGFTGWCVSTQADPGRGNPPCPDCMVAQHQPFDESSAVPPHPPMPHPLASVVVSVEQNPQAAAG